MNKKYDLDFVLKFLAEKDLKLIDKEYISVSKPLNIECNQGHTFVRNLDKLLNRQSKCPTCRVKVQKEHTAKKICSKYNFKYLSYNHGSNNINCVCPKGHQIIKTVESFRPGRESSCKECARLKHIKTRSHSFEYVKEFITSKGEDLVSTEYVNSDGILKVKCVNNHVYDIRFNNFSKGHRCPNCFYKKETECRNIIEELTGKKFIKVRPNFLKYETKNLELDGYCEELNLAFEYDGEQHFFPFTNWGGQSRLDKDQARDRFKDIKCQENNIKLLRIPYSIKDKRKYILDWLITNKVIDI